MYSFGSKQMYIIEYLKKWFCELDDLKTAFCTGNKTSQPISDQISNRNVGLLYQIRISNNTNRTILLKNDRTPQFFHFRNPFSIGVVSINFKALIRPTVVSFHTDETKPASDRSTRSNSVQTIFFKNRSSLGSTKNFQSALQDVISSDNDQLQFLRRKRKVTSKRSYFASVWKLTLQSKIQLIDWLIEPSWNKIFKRILRTKEKLHSYQAATRKFVCIYKIMKNKM